MNYQRTASILFYEIDRGQSISSNDDIYHNYDNQNDFHDSIEYNVSQGENVMEIGETQRLTESNNNNSQGQTETNRTNNHRSNISSSSSIDESSRFSNSINMSPESSDNDDLLSCPRNTIINTMTEREIYDNTSEDQRQLSIVTSPSIEMGTTSISNSESQSQNVSTLQFEPTSLETNANEIQRKFYWCINIGRQYNFCLKKQEIYFSCRKQH